VVVVNPTHPDDWMKNDDTNLQEMSRPKKDVERILSQWYEIIFTHLMKLYYFRDNERDFHGWCTSVWKGAIKVDKVKSPKGKDQLPDAQTIYDWMWGCHEDVFPDWHTGDLKDFNNKSDPDYQDLPYIHAGGDVEIAGEFIKAYHIWLAKELSSKGRVSLVDVQDQIKELLDEYPFKNK